MTAIVGLRTKEKVYIGADSCGSNGQHREAYLTPKLVTRSIAGFRDHSAKLILGYDADQGKKPEAP